MIPLYCDLFPSTQVKNSSCLNDACSWYPMLSTSWTSYPLSILLPCYLSWYFLLNVSVIFFSQLICFSNLFSSDCIDSFSILTHSISSNTYPEQCSLFIKWISATFFLPSSSTSPYLAQQVEPSYLCLQHPPRFLPSPPISCCLFPKPHLSFHLGQDVHVRSGTFITTALERALHAHCKVLSFSPSKPPLQLSFHKTATESSTAVRPLPIMSTV